jgi:hypothetical protein
MRWSLGVGRFGTGGENWPMNEPAAREGAPREG